MFRMWFMTFTGKPRDQHVYEHAHESPLADDGAADRPGGLQRRASPGAGRSWDAEASWLEHTHPPRPADVGAWRTSATCREHDEHSPARRRRAGRDQTSAYRAHELHDLAGNLALGWSCLSASSSPSLLYYSRVLDPAEAKEQFPGVHALPGEQVVLRRAVQRAAGAAGAGRGAAGVRPFDLQRASTASSTASAGSRCGVSRLDGRFDNGVIDGLVNLIGDASSTASARWLRGVQTGYLRSYVLFLVLAAVGIFVVLSYFVSLAAAGEP